MGTATPLAASSGERITSTFKLSSRSLFGTLSPVKFLRKRSNNGSNDGRMVSKSCNSDIGCGTSASGLDGGWEKIGSGRECVFISSCSSLWL